MHHTLRSTYSALIDRLNRFPQGAAESPLLERILALLFSEHEAALVARLPLRPFSAEKAARIWRMTISEAEKTLDTLAARGILLDVCQNGVMTYTLPPPMAGFFEFSLMRVRHDIDQAALSELFYQYINVEDQFIRNLIRGGETQVGRVFVQEQALESSPTLQVYDYEKASEVIRQASSIGVGLCYCRHKMQHLGRSCDAPLEICMTLNNAAQSLIRHEIAREISSAEALDLLDQACERNLVQFGENVQQGVHFLCHCCGCCCEGLLAAKRFAAGHPIHTTRFLPEPKAEAACTGCRLCEQVCPMSAITIENADRDIAPDSPPEIRIDTSRCLGCGICVRRCPTSSLQLVERKKRIVTPIDTAHRFVTQALERGKLQNLIFDEQALFSHRLMAALLGAILRLPPTRRLLAQQQLQSTYLAYLMQVAETISL